MVSVLLFNTNIFNLTSDICLHTVKWLNSSTWTRDGILIGTTTLSLSGPGSNGNEGVLHIPQSSKTEAFTLDSVKCHTQDTC